MAHTIGPVTATSANWKVMARAWRTMRAPIYLPGDAQAWRVDTLGRFPDHKITKVDDVLPWRWNG